MTFYLILGLIGIALWGTGFLQGWNSGVKDTERRWSDAVSRKT